MSENLSTNDAQIVNNQIKPKYDDKFKLKGKISTYLDLIVYMN